MAWSINYIDLSALVTDSSVLTQNSNAALPFQCIRVHNALLHSLIITKNLFKYPDGIRTKNSSEQEGCLVHCIKERQESSKKIAQRTFQINPPSKPETIV
jgi:hypothetical protein